MTRFLAALAAAFYLPIAAAAWEPTTEGLAPIPSLTGRVVDESGTLSAADAQAISAKLAAWEQKTGNQLAVLVVPSTQPEPIEAYTIRVAEAWKIGRKGQDNGAILVVAKNDRKLRIEVGYGLEGSLTDVTSKRIIAETIAPQFRENKFAQGIDAGVTQMMDVVDKGEPLAARPPPKAQGQKPRGFSLDMLLLLVLVVVPVMGSILRRIFGRFLGSAVGAGIVGAGAWVVAGSLLIAIIAAIVAFVIVLVTGTAGLFSNRGGGVWIPSGGGGWGGGGGGGGGGGFSGGGGSFGGGGASGGW
ncbi:MAG: TPM domain-containing protein [Burkholderiales bacterium]